MEHIFKLESDIDRYRSIKKEYYKYKKLSNNIFFGCFYKKKMANLENDFNNIINHLLNSYIFKLSQDVNCYINPNQILHYPINQIHPTQIQQNLIQPNQIQPTAPINQIQPTAPIHPSQMQSTIPVAECIK